MAYPDKPISDTRTSVLHWREGGIAQIRFNRPQALNAIDRAMAGAFLGACSDVANDAAVRCVLVSGAGRTFMAGGDLAEMRDDPQAVAAALIKGMHGGLRVLAQLNAPVVAAVQGAVAGGGLGVILGCDLVVAAEGTRFSVAYPLIGASCDCSTSWGLPRVVGLRRSMELALLGESFDAAAALEMGIVNRVVPATQLDAQAGSMAEKLAAGPTQALGRLKKLLRASVQNDLDTHLDLEAESFQACAGTADFREGVGAFLEKRAARFTGT